MIKIGPNPSRGALLSTNMFPHFLHHLSWNILCAFSGVPSPPSAIALLLCTRSEMVLGWRAPAHNGGDPVRGYYLDQRESGLTVWREVNVKPTKKRTYKVSLSPGCRRLCWNASHSVLTGTDVDLLLKLYLSSSQTVPWNRCEHAKLSAVLNMVNPCQ